MGARYEYWVLDLPSGRVLKGETPIAAANRELAELADRGWEVAGYSRVHIGSAGTFVMRKDR